MVRSRNSAELRHGADSYGAAAAAAEEEGRAAGGKAPKRLSVDQVRLSGEEDGTLKAAIKEHVGKAAKVFVGSKGTMYVRDEQIEIFARIFFMPAYGIAWACLTRFDPDAATRAARPH